MSLWRGGSRPPGTSPNVDQLVPNRRLHPLLPHQPRASLSRPQPSLPDPPPSDRKRSLNLLPFTGYDIVTVDLVDYLKVQERVFSSIRMALALFSESSKYKMGTKRLAREAFQYIRASQAMLLRHFW